MWARKVQARGRTGSGNDGKIGQWGSADGRQENRRKTRKRACESEIAHLQTAQTAKETRWHARGRGKGEHSEADITVSQHPTKYTQSCTLASRGGGKGESPRGGVNKG